MKQYTLRLPTDDGEYIDVRIPENVTLDQLEKVKQFLLFVKKELKKQYILR